MGDGSFIAVGQPASGWADYDDAWAHELAPPAGPPRPHTGGIPGVNYADFDDQTPPVRQQLPGVGGMYQDNPLYPFSMNGGGAYDTYPDFMTRPEHHPGQLTANVGEVEHSIGGK